MTSTKTPAFHVPAEGEVPDLSVVLINWRMGKDLTGLLPSLSTQRTDRATVEVLVVNKPSKDGTEQLCAAHPWIRLIHHPHFGIAEMRNVGIRSSRGRYCLMLDADTEIIEGCFDALVRFMDERPDVAAVGAYTQRPDGEVEHNIKRFYDFGTILMRRTPLGRLWPSNPWIRHHLMLEKDKTTSFYGDWIAGACFCMRREALRDVGLFDERYYFGFEDVDWCWRAKRFGWKIAFCADARIIHKVQRKSARGLNRLTVEHLKSGFRFLWKTRRLRLGYPDDTVGLDRPDNSSRSFRLPVGTTET
jgi:GT2 family glycosyltransferase